MLRHVRFLMGSPDHFAVDYAINPWMDPGSWARNGSMHAAAARREWAALYRVLAGLGATINMLPAVAGVPDLVFTANAAIVLDGTALLARFRHPQRRTEEPLIDAAFQALARDGVVGRALKLPTDITLEGAGDCVFDKSRNIFWMGYGPRSDRRAAQVVEQTFGIGVTALELADPRFYHMDTALNPLPRGEVLYVPAAFTSDGLARIRTLVAPRDRIEIAPDDADALAANAVCVGNTIVLSACGARLRATLEDRGYRVIETPLPSFLRSGGSAFCLTLRLDRRSADGAAKRAQAAVA